MTRQKPTDSSLSNRPAIQHDRFIETARKLECDEDEARFKEKLGKIAKAKPKTETK
jgi:hypothetical protein